MKKKFRQQTALLVLGVMLCLAGCGSRGGGTAQEEETGLSMASGGQKNETGMGRYLEQEVVLPEEVTSMSTCPSAYLQQLNNGDLALMETVAGLYISSDRGQTWTQKSAPWHSGLDDAWISQISLAPNGAAAVIYVPYETEDSEEDESEEATGQVSEYIPEYLYADPDGDTRKLEAPDPKEVLQQFWFGRDSRLYACDMGGKVYEMDVETKTAKMLFEMEGISDYVCFTRRYLIMISTRSEVILYDLVNKTVSEEDKVLQEFVKNRVGNSIGASADGYGLVAAGGEQEDVLYLAYSGGLYRHVIGGSAMEQLLDGSISSLGDPMMYLCGFAALPDNEFLVLYDQARLCRYVYDPDMPTVPKEQISIYSLTEDYTMRQAVSLFQKAHPQIYVRYEVGLLPDGGMTSEDAVKNLNTKIMSGDGPDLLMLDGLPLASYEEKGVLTDLSGIVHGMEEENPLFKNLVDTCRVEGRLYYLPIRFRLPLLVGDQESIQKVTDLASLADVLESLRMEQPKGALIGLRSEEEVLRTLEITSAGTWLDPVTKSLDQEKLTEFLLNARRIYQAETAGMDAGELLEEQENDRERWQSDVAGEGMYYAVASANAVDVAMGIQKLGVGTTYQVDCEFNTVATLEKQEENFGYAPWQGQMKDGFVPKCMVGICAGSEEKEQVQEFFRFLYGRELQDLDLPSGFPMNEASFENLRVNPREEYGNAGLVLVSNNNVVFSLDVQWCTEEDFERLKQMVQSASSICTGDARIEQIVCELGVKALNGSASVEDTVAEIVRKAAISLAE